MATDVVMPQMGESITEGTIVRWIKKVGDAVDRDEPLFEISTDKVDAEIPSPTAGILTDIRAKEGDTVAVGSVVAVIGQAGEVDSRQSTVDSRMTAVTTQQSGTKSAISSQQSTISVRQVDERPTSPAVRRLAREHNIDLSKIQGTGAGGRVTREDVQHYVAGQSLVFSRQSSVDGAAPIRHPQPAIGNSRVEKLSVMRKRIAEHMVLSRRTSAHVHSVFEVNFSRVAQLREAKKAEYERAGGKLTYLTFILKAVVDALTAMPAVNASIDGENIIFHQDVNVGIAVALEWGLIVPVIKQAAGKSLLDLSREVADLASRARAKQLKPEDVADGTFTITNQGVSGALLGLPIINQPQVAILGVGSVEKRPVVVDDAVVAKPTAYLALGFDHRLIDGAVADEFLSRIKRALENWDSTNT